MWTKISRDTIYVNKDDNGEINAFIALWNFDGFVFIEHFAVSQTVRNCGIGSNILNSVKSITDKIICLEVEIPKGEFEKRRVAFYERNGFFLNEYDYTQPPISQGKNLVPLMIMTSGRKINNCEFENIKQKLYKVVYKNSCV